jgi:sugar/nucleoside kinase (ribokinase family)
MLVLRIDSNSPYQQVVGIGGIGTGIFFALEENHTLGRNESRPGRLLDIRDYCKLHIVSHYVAKLLAASSSGEPFHVVPVGKIGNDAAGQFVLNEMRAVGMDTRFVGIVPDKPTLFSACFQYPDGAGGNITTSNSAAAALCNQDLDGIGELLAASGRRAIALLVPEAPLEVRKQFLSLATRGGAFRAASFVLAEIQPAIRFGMFEQLDLVALNEGEAEEFVGSSFSTKEPTAFLDKCQALIRNSYPGLRMVVSVGKDGSYGLTRDELNYCPAPEVEVASTAGAGDCLLGGVVAATAAGIPFVSPSSRRKSLTDGPLATALEFAVLLASYKVTSPHTIHPTASLTTLVDFAHGLGVSFAPDLERLFVEKRDDKPRI